MGLSLSSETKPLGVALIGAGMVAKTHMAAISDASKTGQMFLCGIYDRCWDNAKTLLAETPGIGGDGPCIYETLDALIADPNVEAVIIVTPPNARIDLVTRLAGAGKHILLEKPIARNSNEASQIIALCEKANVTLGVVFQHRFREASKAAKRLVDSGQLGRLAMVDVAVPWWRDQGYYDEPGRGTYERDGGGVLISQAIHTLDLMLHLAGPVKSVQALTATTSFHKMESEDFAVAGLHFANGAVGSLVASTASFPGTAETIALHFEHASLRLDSGVLTVSWRDGKEEKYGAEGGTGGGADPMAFTHDWHRGVLEDFVQAIQINRIPQVTGRDGLLAHKLITTIEMSAREGRILEVEK